MFRDQDWMCLEQASTKFLQEVAAGRINLSGLAIATLARRAGASDSPVEVAVVSVSAAAVAAEIDPDAQHDRQSDRLFDMGYAS